MSQSQTTTMPILDVTGLSVRYGKVEALHGAAMKVGAGQNTLYDGKFRWTEPDPNGGQSVKIGTLPPPSGTAIAGMALDGDLSLSFNNQKGADLTGNTGTKLEGTELQSAEHPGRE